MINETFGRPLFGVIAHFWGLFPADPPLLTDGSKLPGDLYLNTTTRQLKMVDATRRAWVTVGQPKVYDDFTGALLDEYTWTKNTAGAGVVIIAAHADSKVGGALFLQDTGAVGDNHAQVSLGGNRCLQRGSLTVIAFRVMLNSGWLNFRAVLFNNGAFDAVGDWAGFEADGPVGDQWYIRSSVGGAAVVRVDTGIAVVPNVYVDLAIVIYQNVAYMYINGVQVGTISAANLTALQLEPLVFIDDDNTMTGKKSAFVDIIAAYQ
jgi:hypothetical protein